jgi:transmembrane sensor
MADAHDNRDATDWLIRLQDEPDDGDLRREFETWHGASSDHAAAWAEVAQAYELIGEATRPIVVVLQPRHAPRQRIRLGLGLAAAALAAAVAVFWLPDLMLRARADYATATGEWRTVRLADGSSVTLGPHSAIDADLTGADRRLRLLAGRAFFEVVHDPARPFTVEAHGVRTTVLGTGFDVELGPDDASVAVEHGIVRVDYPAAANPVSRRLWAGDWVRIGWDGAAIDGSEAPEQVASWRDGHLVVDDQPVSTVVEALRASYSGLILVTGGALDGKRVTGVYDLHAPAAALDALAQAHHAHVTHLAPWLMVLSGD